MPEILHPDPGKDQDRDGQRPLDPPGAAPWVALHERPRPLLLGKPEEPPDHLLVVELREPNPVALAHSPRLRLQPPGDPLELVEVLFVQPEVMTGDGDELGRHLVRVAGILALPLGQKRPERLAEVVAFEQDLDARYRIEVDKPASDQCRGRSAEGVAVTLESSRAEGADRRRRVERVGIAHPGLEGDDILLEPGRVLTRSSEGSPRVNHVGRFADSKALPSFIGILWLEFRVLVVSESTFRLMVNIINNYELIN
jgi:hypothetical protein